MQELGCTRTGDCSKHKLVHRSQVCENPQLRIGLTVELPHWPRSVAPDVSDRRLGRYVERF